MSGVDFDFSAWTHIYALVHLDGWARMPQLPWHDDAYRRAASTPIDWASGPWSVDDTSSSDRGPCTKRLHVSSADAEAPHKLTSELESVRASRATKQA